jgi:hypothetical protein
MTITRQQIGNTLIKIQSQFLLQPRLSLTAEEVGRRFGYRLTLSRAVLDLLADAGVLDKSPDDVYSRRLPSAVMREAHTTQRSRSPRASARPAA